MPQNDHETPKMVTNAVKCTKALQNRPQTSLEVSRVQEAANNAKKWLRTGQEQLRNDHKMATK